MKNNLYKYLSLSFHFFLVSFFFAVLGYYLDLFFFEKISIFSFFLPFIGFFSYFYFIYKKMI
ncbi:MAG: hypothetical protein CNE34_05335 [Rhodothermaeota bacterium MED-G18]|nr:MAG: hypothetical protein CNE34_05335 [Rhodothermaeota bacterium MED-G18]